MTPRAVVLLLMASATLFAAANVGVGWLYALGFLFVAYLLFSYLLAFLAIAGVRVSVRAGTSAEAGGTLPVVVTLENPGRSPRSFLSVIAPPVGEVIPGWMRWMRGPLFPEDWGFAVASEVPPHGSASVSLPVPTPRRGLYRLPDFLLQAPAHGLGAVQRRVPTVGRRGSVGDAARADGHGGAGAGGAGVSLGRRAQVGALASHGQDRGVADQGVGRGTAGRIDRDRPRLGAGLRRGELRARLVGRGVALGVWRSPRPPRPSPVAAGRAAG